MHLDPALLSQPPSAETLALNEAIVRLIDGLPDKWSVPPEEIRAARRAGRSSLPVEALNPSAEVRRIDGPRGPIELRLIRPAGDIRGAYLFIHGGGWVLGAPDQQDERLTRLADACGLLVVSTQYRLAPEYPYPAGPDDCEAAALWLIEEGRREFGVDWFAIGGESAGGHLSAVTLLRLRDKHGAPGFHAANLIAGCFDLSMTPSARCFGNENLVLTSRDVEMFVRHFLLHGGDPRQPDVSPLYADLGGLPPALFTVGTRDCLLDDSLFMAARWTAAGNEAEVAAYPGGSHMFHVFTDTALAQAGLGRMEAFLAAQRARRQA